MACCGQRRAQVAGTGRGVGSARVIQRPSKIALYEYTGATGMTVTGPVSGAKYRFAQPGAKVQIDPRDLSSMTGLPNLRRIQ
jgi:hypothetical protein